MPGFWGFLKKPRNLLCSLKSGDVPDPVKNGIQRTSPCSGCSRSLRSLSDLRNHEMSEIDERALQIPSIGSSRSMESSDFLNALRFDEFVIDDSRRCKCSSGDESNLLVRYSHRTSLIASSASSSDIVTGRCCSQRCFESDICQFGALACQRCHQKVRDLDAFEAHFFSKHSVTALVAGDFSRKVVELICNTGRSSKSDKTRGDIVAILRVHNMQKTVAEFENYRETVKIRSTKLPKRHPRCLADGNEFLGFHGTVIACSLGLNGSSEPCLSDQCGVCLVLRHGFFSKTVSDGIDAVLVSSTSYSALENVEVGRGRSRGVRKALLLCRAIAGRVHKPLKRFQQFPAASSSSSAYDSVAAKIGPNSSIEELYLLSTKALLPCFVIIFKS